MLNIDLAVSLDLFRFKDNVSSVGFGTPQLGQTEASVETFLLHSLQDFNAIEILCYSFPNNFLSNDFEDPEVSDCCFDFDEFELEFELELLLVSSVKTGKAPYLHA